MADSLIRFRIFFLSLSFSFYIFFFFLYRGRRFIERVPFLRWGTWLRLSRENMLDINVFWILIK